MEEKRMVGDYTVLQSIRIGHKNIVLAENKKAEPNERFLCCFVEDVLVFEKYSECLVSNDYAEIAKVYGDRIHDAATEIIKENELAANEVGDDSVFTADDCDRVESDDLIENKVIVIKSEFFRPEFQRATKQLMLCTGGFGSQPNPRGRTCYCINLYTGERTSFYRSDVLGTIEPSNLPEWAKVGLEKAKEIQREDRTPPSKKERGEAR